MCCGEWSDEVLMYVKLSFVFCTVFLYFVLNLKLCPKKPTYVKFVVISILKSILLTNSIMSPNQPIKKWNRQKKKIPFENNNENLLSQLKYYQWRNTNEVIHWFSKINEKQNCKFIQLDIKEFYPSISE